MNERSGAYEKENNMYGIGNYNDAINSNGISRSKVDQ